MTAYVPIQPPTIDAAVPSVYEAMVEMVDTYTRRTGARPALIYLAPQQWNRLRMDERYARIYRGNGASPEFHGIPLQIIDPIASPTKDRP